MRTALHLSLVFLLGASVLPISLCDEGGAPNSLSRLAPVPPCPALVAAAQANQIPLEQIDPPGEAEQVNPGDSLTALVTLCEKGAPRKQWLVFLQAVTPNSKEQSAKPSAPMVLYACRGTRLEFESSPAVVSLRTLGPFSESEAETKLAKPKDKSARFALNQGFLRIGLDRAAAVICRLNQGTAPGAFVFRQTPFRDAEAREGRKFAETVQLTTDEERALGGALPALMSYVNVIQQTQGLNDILFKILDRPSVWSVLRRGGVNAGLSFQSEQVAPAPATGWGMKDFAPAFQLPMLLTLNHHPALNITLVVTSPRPPLLACGGVVGLLAENLKDKQTYLTLRIVSARRSEFKR